MENFHHFRDTTQADAAPKKTAAVVQAVVAEEKRQMEMDFVMDVTKVTSAKELGDEEVKTAFDALDLLATSLRDESN